MRTNKQQFTLSAIIFFLIAMAQIGAYVQAAIRRPISPNQPMFHGPKIQQC